MRKFAVLIGLLFCGCGYLNTGTIVTPCVLASYLVTPETGKEVPIGRSDNYGGHSAAQSFIVSQTGTSPSPSPSASPSPTSLLSSPPVVATVQLAAVGAFVKGQDTLVATIESDNAGVPDGNALSTSAPIDVVSISATPKGYTFQFQSAPGLVIAQKYWLRIKGSYVVGNANYINWSANNTTAYQVSGQVLNAVYETSTINSFSTSLISLHRFLYFKLGC